MHERHHQSYNKLTLEFGEVYGVYKIKMKISFFEFTHYLCYTSITNKKQKDYVITQSTHKNSNHNPATVTPRELLNFGLDPAVVWNVDRDKKIKSQIFIVSALMNGYSEHIVSKLVAYFGKETVMQSLEHYRNRVSDALFYTVKNYTEHPQRTA